MTPSITMSDARHNIVNNGRTVIHSKTYSGVPRNFFRGGGSTNSVEDRGQRERGSRGVAPYSGALEAAVIWYNKFNFV